MKLQLPSGQFYGDKLLVRQIAGFNLTETRYAANTVLPRHSHERACFCLVLNGLFVQGSARGNLECGPLNLLFCTPEESHHDHFHRAGARCFIIEPSPSLMDKIQHHTAVLKASAFFAKGSTTWLALKLYQEFKQMDQLSPLAIEGLTIDLAVESSRRMGKSQHRERPSWLIKVLDFLDTEYATTFDLSRLASIGSVHPAHLVRVFRKFEHCTIGDYVRKRRVEFACRQISNGKASFAEIAYEAGFSSQAHFSTTFKKLTGCTPAAYRSLSTHD